MADGVLGSDFVLSISTAWAARLSAADQGLLHVLAVVPEIHAWWGRDVQAQSLDHQPKGFGKKGKPKSGNPLADNPFVAGLCRLKIVAVGEALPNLIDWFSEACSRVELAGGGWQELYENHSFSQACRPGTASFLQLLLRSWQRLLRTSVRLWPEDSISRGPLSRV